MVKKHSTRGGFALPTVIITSVVMMIVLLASLQSISSISAGINSQYEQKIMNETMESGVAYASSCISDSTSTPTWSATTPLTNSTDCDGTPLAACTSGSSSGACGVMNSKVQTSFSAVIETSNGVSTVSVTGTVNFKRTSDNAVYRTTTDNRKLSVAQVRNSDNDRAVQRYWQLGATEYSSDNSKPYTGVSRLDFGKTGTTSPSTTQGTVTATQTPTNGAQYREGITVVTDKDGNYQFSTNGIDAWNINNTRFTSSNLGASDSTSQGVIAFPIGKSNQYVIIGNSAGDDTPGSDNPGAYGKLTRTIVTMSGTNGSVGSLKTYELADLNSSSLTNSDQVEKEPNGTNFYTGQFMSAAPEKNGKGYWVVFATPGKGYFYALLFNNSGNLVRVKRSAAPGGEIPVCGTVSSTQYYRAGFGTLRFNNAYTKFALKAGAYTGYGTKSDCSQNRSKKLPTNYNVDDDNDTFNQGRDYLMNFDADASSGAITGNLYWDGTNSTGCLDNSKANAGYSIDFSPNENYLYDTNIYPGRIFRYRITGGDIDLNDSSTITATRQFVATSDDYTIGGSLSSGQIRRAPDGRMYVALQYSNKISYIDAPDDASTKASTCANANSDPANAGSASNFNYNAFSLGGSANGGVKSSLGLPDYVTRYIPRRLQY